MDNFAVLLILLLGLAIIFAAWAVRSILIRRVREYVKEDFDVILPEVWENILDSESISTLVVWIGWMMSANEVPEGLERVLALKSGKKKQAG